MDRDGQNDHGGEQPRQRGRPNKRNTTDIGSTYVHWMRNRWAKRQGRRGFEAERPTPSYIIDMLPPAARRTRPVDTIPAKHLHASFNKVRHPVNVVKWTPEGRRLLTGSTSGEFTLWNGTSFNFETIMQAHDTAVRALEYAHNDEWLISADQEGVVKYWQTNFNNVKEIQAHTEPIRDLAFAPTDSKFVTACDDASLKIFDFASSIEESVLSGHQWDAKSVDWHPTKGLIASGSKDYQMKLWDPRTGRCLTTLHGHKNTVYMTRFEPTRGVLLASCARDSTARIFDIRMMRDVFLLKGHEKEINSVTWHPIHSSMVTTGGSDGAMHHYLLDEQNAPAGVAPSLSPYYSPDPADAAAQTLYPAHKVPFAHEYNIWSMDWHPLGHILASGSNDRATRFWTRARPGESETIINDKWHIGQDAAEAKGTWKKSDYARIRGNNDDEDDQDDQDDADALEDQNVSSAKGTLPGLPSLPGLMSTGIGAPSIPSLPVAPPPNFPPPIFTNGAPQIPFPTPDFAAIQKAFPGANLPPLPPGFPPLPIPTDGQPPAFQPPPGFPALPPGFPAPPPGFSLPGMPPLTAQVTDAANGANGARRRAPLPSQQDSLKEEMRQGRYTKAR